MQQALRLVIAAFVAIAFAQFSSSAFAQSEAKQVKLTEKHIEGFIAAQKDMESFAEKLQGGATDKPDPKMQGELENIAKKHGFANFNEYDDVAATISNIMAGIDPSTKVFSDPSVAIKKEMEEVTGDKTIADAEKKQMLDDLKEALKAAQPIQYPTNIELVTKYFDKLDAVLQ
ncbi:MAG TPA: hypothetical protein VFR73_16330 [Hyphomicrobiaceae bacterium]|jgi:hypothetical protein|nr:hypothetical protein [Hyphomicrobiaceae bacterium]HEX2338593.1 hypothetical protein [Hyphomicrobiaceae bacterium]